jgi:chromosome segregation ATPase
MTKAIRKDSGVGARIKLAEAREKHRELEELLVQAGHTAEGLQDRLASRNKALRHVTEQLNVCSRSLDEALQAHSEESATVAGLEHRNQGLVAERDVATANARRAWAEYRDMRRLARVLGSTTVALLVAVAVLLVL